MSRDPRVELVLEGLKRLVREENRHSDPPSAHHVPHDVAHWFLRLVLSGDEKSIVRAFGLRRPPGRPVDPNKLKNFDLAEKALIRKMQGKTWIEINNEIFADRAEPPDERYIRTLVTRYGPLIMQKWRKALHRRWLARSEERKQRAILKNSRRGKPDL